MVSDIQKKARNKWDSNNMAVLGCKIRKDDAEAFKASCKQRGTTPNAVFRQAIDEFMERDSEKTAVVHSEQKPKTDKVSAAKSLFGLFPDGLSTPDDISSTVLEAAQEAAQAAGETTPQFIARAVETQAQRDKVTQKMKGGPLSGD